MKDKSHFSELPELLTVKDIAGILSQSEQTIRRLCREGELPSVRIGRRLYVPRHEFAEHIENALKAGR